MVMVAARTDERGIGAKLLHQFKAKYPTVEIKCPLQDRNFEVDVSDSQSASMAGLDSEFGFVVSMCRKHEGKVKSAGTH